MATDKRLVPPAVQGMGTEEGLVRMVPLYVKPEPRL
jgi:hypothetical protein